MKEQSNSTEQQCNKQNVKRSSQPAGFEWLDDVPAEIRDIYCEKCKTITEQEVNPYTTDGCGNIVFGWTCCTCGDCAEILERDDA